MFNNAIFDSKFVFEYSDERAFKKIPHNKLMDFLPRIYNSELSILDSWENHFKSNRIPYALSRHVTEYSDRQITHMVLWKERRI